MPFRHSFYGFWAALLLFFGLLAPAAAQRGGDDGAYQILSARYGTSERYVDVTERVRSMAASSPAGAAETVGTAAARAMAATMASSASCKRCTAPRNTMWT